MTGTYIIKLGKAAYKVRTTHLCAMTRIAVLVTFVPIVLCGCGGGGSSLVKSSVSARAADTLVPGKRSVKLNNYNNWGMGSDNSPQALQNALINLSKRDNILVGEQREKLNSIPGWDGITSQSIKRLNPTAKVYRYYALACKTAWDTDWKNPNESVHYMQTPLTKVEIDEHDWWLRDGNGEIVKETEDQWFIDVGKPGVKERYLEACLERSRGKGLDGFVFDYWIYSLKRWVDLAGLPRPAAYPTEADWFEKAWKPFTNYVMDGLHKAGYRVIGNCIGEYGTTNTAQIYCRSKADGVVYEQGVVDWWGNGSNWLPGYLIEQRLNAIYNDPLEVWVADGGLRDYIEDYERKSIVSLAAYYIAIPPSQAKRSYHHAYDWSCYWKPIWDFYIGTPAEQAKKMSDKYFWSRKYTEGFVVMNYEASESISFTLDGKYRDDAGSEYSGVITIPPHTAYILAKVQ